MRRTILAPVLALTLLVTFAACSTNNDTVGQQNTGGGGGTQIGPGVDCTNGPNFTDCPCNAGETKACYTGSAATRGVGACHDGVQTCTEQQELRYTFGACTGETLPTAMNGGCVADGSGGGGGGPTNGCATGECDPAIAAPRPIGPTSTGRVSAWRPTLRWELAPGTDGARVTLCHDRACTSIISILDATGTSVKVSADLSPGVVYWTLTGRSGAKRGTTSGPVWQFVVGHKSAPADTSWGTMFDANGDGYADLLAAAKSQGVPPTFPKGQGRLYVYQGAPTGVPAKPTATLAAPADASYFGWSVASAGDVNGDGYADAIVGTNGGLPNCGGGSPGYSPDQVWIYFGGPNGLGATPSVKLEGPNAGVGTCGVACVSMACGSFNPACMADCDYFGSFVSSGGDINGDGYADVLVGTSLGNAAYVYYGSASGVDAKPTKLTGSNVFGSIISGIGDVNGDGFADVGVGNGNSIVLFLGSAGGLVTTPIALLPGSKGAASPTGGMARGIDCAGDVNGDGYADVVTTTHGGNTNDPMGVPGYVYYGGPGGVTAAPAEVWSGGGSSSTWLNRTAGGGDLNGDGYSDVLWGGSFFKVHVGSASGVQPSYVTEIKKGANIVLGAGDLNGDGFGDALSETTVYYGTATGIVPGQGQVLSAPVGDVTDQSGFGSIVGGSAGL